MRRSLTFLGLRHNIEKIKRKLMFLRFCKVRCRDNKGGWVLELFPTLPTYQNPININPGPLLLGFLDFSVFTFWSVFSSFWPYCPGGTKRRNSNSNSLFLGSKTGIRFDTKWHHNWPNQLLTARISIQIPVRVFLYFQKKKWIQGFWDKKEESVTNYKC